jgi:hypothetical protein
MPGRQGGFGEEISLDLETGESTVTGGKDEDTTEHNSGSAEVWSGEATDADAGGDDS